MGLDVYFYKSTRLMSEEDVKKHNDGYVYLLDWCIRDGIGNIRLYGYGCSIWDILSECNVRRGYDVFRRQEFYEKLIKPCEELLVSTREPEEMSRKYYMEILKMLWQIHREIADNESVVIDYSC